MENNTVAESPLTSPADYASDGRRMVLVKGELKKMSFGTGIEYKKLFRIMRRKELPSSEEIDSICRYAKENSLYVDREDWTKPYRENRMFASKYRRTKKAATMHHLMVRPGTSPARPAPADQAPLDDCMRDSTLKHPSHGLCVELSKFSGSYSPTHIQGVLLGRRAAYPECREHILALAQKFGIDASRALPAYAGSAPLANIDGIRKLAAYVDMAVGSVTSVLRGRIKVSSHRRQKIIEAAALLGVDSSGVLPPDDSIHYRSRDYGEKVSELASRLSKNNTPYVYSALSGSIALSDEEYDLLVSAAKDLGLPTDKILKRSTIAKSVAKTPSDVSGASPAKSSDAGPISSSEVYFVVRASASGSAMIEIVNHATLLSRLAGGSFGSDVSFINPASEAGVRSWPANAVAIYKGELVIPKAVKSYSI